MKISSSAYFAVESLVRLAAYDAKRPCSVEALSHSVGCSESFTEQLMAELCVAGPRQRHLAAGPRLLPEQAPAPDRRGRGVPCLRRPARPRRPSVCVTGRNGSGNRRAWRHRSPLAGAQRLHSAVPGRHLCSQTLRRATMHRRRIMWAEKFIDEGGRKNPASNIHGGGGCEGWARNQQGGLLPWLASAK